MSQVSLTGERLDDDHALVSRAGIVVELYGIDVEGLPTSASYALT